LQTTHDTTNTAQVFIFPRLMQSRTTAVLCFYCLSTCTRRGGVSYDEAVDGWPNYHRTDDV